MAKANSTPLRSGRRSADIPLRCKKGDLAMYITGRYVGKIVDVVEYYGTVAMDDGEVLINAWHVRHPNHEPGITFFREDKAMLPIRPGDLDETDAKGYWVGFFSELSQYLMQGSKKINVFKELDKRLAKEERL